MKQINAKKITAENFKEFGSFTDLLNPDGYSLGGFLSGQTENAQFRCYADGFFSASGT